MHSSLISRYIWLIQSLRRRPMSLEELTTHWQLSSLNDTGARLSRPTLYRHIAAIRSLFGLHIRSRQGRYCITDSEQLQHDDLTRWLVDSLSIDAAVRESKQLHERIIYEPIPVGHDLLMQTIDAMQQEHTLLLQYRNYYQPKPEQLEVEPYCVKVFRQRWYVLAHVLHNACPDEPMRIFALDQVLSLAQTEHHWTFPTGFHADEYFQPFFGVINDPQDGVELVRIRVSAKQTRYLRTLPLHPTQTEVETHPDYSIFEYRLVPTFDFEMELRMHGHELEVLTPDWLRADFAWDTRLSAQLYN